MRAKNTNHRPRRARVGRAQFSPRAMASHAAFRAPLGRQLGTRSTCRSSSSPSLRAVLVPARRGAARSPRRVVALDRSREGGMGGDDGAMDTNVLYERMRALQAKEASENSAIVEAAIEKDQAIVAGIRGDAAERPTPERACHERARTLRAPKACDATTLSLCVTSGTSWTDQKKLPVFFPKKQKKQPARLTRSSSTS